MIAGNTVIQLTQEAVLDALQRYMDTELTDKVKVTDCKLDYTSQKYSVSFESINNKPGE